MNENDLTTWPGDELYRVAGILSCERMILSRPPEIEEKIDRKIADLNEEIARRTRAALLPSEREKR